MVAAIAASAQAAATNAGVLATSSVSAIKSATLSASTAVASGVSLGFGSLITLLGRLWRFVADKFRSGANPLYLLGALDPRLLKAKFDQLVYRRSYLKWLGLASATLPVVAPGELTDSRFSFCAGPVPPMFTKAWCQERFIEAPPQHESAEISYKKLDFVCKPKLGAVLCGVGFAGWVPLVVNSCSHNEHAAIVQRVTLATQEPDPTVWLNYPTTSPLLPTFDERDPDEAAWLASQPGPKRRHYVNGVLDMASERKLGDHELFVKRENMIKTHVLYPEFGILRPRAIQTSTPDSNFRAGPDCSSYAHALGENDCLAQPRFKNFTLLYDAPPEEMSHIIGMQLEEIGPCLIFTLDANSQDASVPVDLLDINRRDYAASGFTEDALEAIDANRTLRGRSRSGIRYKREGSIATGVQWTTLNHSKSYATILEAFNPTAPLTWHYFCKSDDGLLLVSLAAGMDAAMALFREYRAHVLCHGFKLSAQATINPVGAEFLSLRLHVHGPRVLMVPKLGRMMSKLFWSAYPSEVINHYSYAHTVAVGLRAYQAVPILGVLLEKVLNLTVHALFDEKSDARKYKQILYSNAPGFDRDTMVQQYCELYECGVEDILRLESAFRAIKSLPWVISDPLMDRIITVDLGIEHNPLDILQEEPVKFLASSLPTAPGSGRFVPNSPSSILFHVAVEEAVLVQHPWAGVICGLIESVLIGTPYNLVLHIGLTAVRVCSPVAAVFCHAWHNLSVV
jgi:hypothetical protein